MAAFPGPIFYASVEVAVILHHVHYVSVSVAVLIGFADTPVGSQPGADPPEMLAFADTELPRALEVILERRPRMVIVNEAVATSSPAIALIERIRYDAALQPCEVRIVPFGESMGPLDMTGTRRAPRFQMAEGLNVDIDGKPVTLVNLSLVGAQIISPTILKPKQRLRFSLASEGKPIRIQSVVATVAVEIIQRAPRYRAGIEFFNADYNLLQGYIDKHKKK